MTALTIPSSRLITPLNVSPSMAVFRSPRTSSSDGSAPSISALIFLRPTDVSDRFKFIFPDSTYSSRQGKSEAIDSAQAEMFQPLSVPLS